MPIYEVAVSAVKRGHALVCLEADDEYQAKAKVSEALDRGTISSENLTFHFGDDLDLGALIAVVLQEE